MAAAAAATNEKALYIHASTWSREDGRGYGWYKVDLEENKICRVFENLIWPAAFLKYYPAVALDSVIYILGVVASQSQLRRIMCENKFDAVVYTDTKYGDDDDAKWRFAPHMKCSRRAPTLVALHGKIYAFGGHKPGDHFAEVFDPNKGCWDFLPPPPGSFADYVSTPVLTDSSTSTSTSTSTSSGKGSRILVHFAFENSLYAYHLGEESWRCLNPHFGDWYEQCVLVDDVLYCHTGDDRFLIAYDLVKNEWLTTVWSDSDLSIPENWDVLLHLGSNKFCVAFHSAWLNNSSPQRQMEMTVDFFQFLINKDLAGNLLITPATSHSFMIEGGTNVDNYLIL